MASTCGLSSFRGRDRVRRLIDKLLRKWIAERVPRDRVADLADRVKGSPFRGWSRRRQPFRDLFGRDRKVTRAIEQYKRAKPQNAIARLPAAFRSCSSSAKAARGNHR